MAFDTLDFDALREKPEISALDVVRLRDALSHEGPLAEDEACALIDIELSPVPKALGWKPFFIDALLGFSIHDVPPDGYLTADKADWLLRCAAPEGRILTPTVFELLTALLAAARWVPQRLVSALFDEIYCAVANGDGPLRTARGVGQGVITPRDVAIVRHILYASGKADLRAITRAEAAGLMAIDLAGQSSSQPSVWDDLFASALFDAVLSASGRIGPEREVYLQASPHVVDSVSLADHIVARASRYRTGTTEDAAIAALERQRIAIVTGDDVEACTAEWLAAVMARSQSGSSAQALLVTVAQAHGAVLDQRLGYRTYDGGGAAGVRAA